MMSRKILSAGNREPHVLPDYRWEVMLNDSKEPIVIQEGKRTFICRAVPPDPYLAGLPRRGVMPVKTGTGYLFTFR